MFRGPVDEPASEAIHQGTAYLVLRDQSVKSAAEEQEPAERA